ncbi:hypothetical protein AGMMS49936_00150 [Endomicrobiia bacterium]|nr:hypothetical protein AGMMS49936_00150 [Endomicrobiia bacterium]
MDLLSYKITDSCVGCAICTTKCPVKAISGQRRHRHEIDASKCIKCGACTISCKFRAIVRG